MTNSPYRLIQTVHLDAPRHLAWESLKAQAARQLYSQIEPGQWYAVRVTTDDRAGDYWMRDLMIELQVIELSEQEPPRYAPMPYEEMPACALVGSALSEIAARVRRRVSRLFR